MDAATRALAKTNPELKRIPGRGKSNVWEIEEEGQVKRVAVRTTQDRWFAFPPMENGTKWKTLSDVDVVVVASVDVREDPKRVEVYRFDADEVRKRFDESYAARTGAGQSEPDGYGMWVALDKDHRCLPASVGSGLAVEHARIATYPLNQGVAKEPVAADEKDEDAVAGPEPETIATVMGFARARIAELSGVPEEAVKLDCRIEP
ncbi:MAG: hypothetical protein OXN81_11805 [Alphaproteobacteria bacterium]|nr:hypothetical protein [Alphaproteobacteria bacterium]